MYSGHIQNATVARISPSGYYCASADVTGKGESILNSVVNPSIESVEFTVNVWDTVGEDQVLKVEYRVLSGRVYVTVS